MPGLFLDGGQNLARTRPPGAIAFPCWVFKPLAMEGTKKYCKCGCRYDAGERKGQRVELRGGRADREFVNNTHRVRYERANHLVPEFELTELIEKVRDLVLMGQFPEEHAEFIDDVQEVHRELIDVAGMLPVLIGSGCFTVLLGHMDDPQAVERAVATNKWAANAARMLRALADRIQEAGQRPAEHFSETGLGGDLAEALEDFPHD